MKGSDYHRVAEAITFLTANTESQPSLGALATHLGLSEYHTHRLFKKWAGVTPKDFLQALTLTRAKQLLAESKSLLETSLAVGLSGTGRLHDLFVGLEAMTPGEFKQRAEGLVIRWGIHPTVYGPVRLATTERGICDLSFVESDDAAAHENEMLERWPRATCLRDQKHTASFAGEINARMLGQGQNPLPLAVRGSPFQMRVWKALLAVPEGQVVTYQMLARAIDAPAAARAVGTAVGANPIAYLIPCHRVIRASGVIGEYHWGSSRKELILTVEAARRSNS